MLARPPPLPAGLPVLGWLLLDAPEEKPSSGSFRLNDSSPPLMPSASERERERKEHERENDKKMSIAIKRELESERERQKKEQKKHKRYSETNELLNNRKKKERKSRQRRAGRRGTIKVLRKEVIKRGKGKALKREERKDIRK